ncbi:chemotaxis protein CheW [Candidatus Nitrosotenuis cloacae]|uniref:chemotaxis protein CheW n=1 Tax=Candidatus Nitrosotenuis cloacae TaxID=1603555 RepID=UPI00069B2EA1|nr:chemotaxis protein CheW [Candidatus Nitrosotenuis cloacae]
MSAQAASVDTIQVVSFMITNQSNKKEDYAIPIEQVREIRSVEKITRVPRSESHVKGIMNLRGLIIPVIDVKEKLGLGTRTAADSKQRILVANIADSLTGLLVDEVDQVMRIQTKDIDSAPQGATESHHYIKGIAKLDQRLIILLDAEALLLGKRESVEKETKQSESKTSEVPKISETQSTEMAQVETANQTINDIPPELAAVFAEDEQGIPPTQIIREETLS